MLRAFMGLACLLAVTGCSSLAFQPGGQALISAKTPAAANSQGSEPEPANSLPPGAEGMGTGPNARTPDYGALRVTAPYL